jgi:hypothetical protein
VLVLNVTDLIIRGFRLPAATSKVTLIEVPLACLAFGAAIYFARLVHNLEYF